MAENIQRIETNGTGAVIAVRLCNFVRGQASPLDAHRTWLDDNVRPKIMPLTNPWVDLIGYASRLGAPDKNQTLSENRCHEVKKHISGYSPKISFPMEFGKGESESGSDESNDSGYFRAVEVWVYGSRPATRPQIPKPSKQTSVRRITHRSFFKVEYTKIFDGEPKEQPGKDIVAAINSWLLTLANPEEALGDENLKERKTIFVPSSHRVNRVTIDVKLNYDWAEKDPIFVQTGTLTSTSTNFDYEWGPPFPHVEIIRKYQPTIFGKTNPTSTDRLSVPRKKAESMPFIVPPKVT